MRDGSAEAAEASSSSSAIVLSLVRNWIWGFALSQSLSLSLSLFCTEFVIPSGVSFNFYSVRAFSLYFPASQQQMQVKSPQDRLLRYLFAGS